MHQSNIKFQTFNGGIVIVKPNLGLATRLNPPLKLIIGSFTKNADITIIGLALIVLPTVIVGNDL